jgi:RND family efflux transporter MFP subunit
VSSNFGSIIWKWTGIVARVLPVMLGLVGLSVAIAWISGAFTKKIEPGESRSVFRQLEDQQTDVVHEITKDYIEEAVGTLKAANRSEISAKVLATIQEIHVAAGDFVQHGDLLVVLNTQELQARLNQAQESLSAASAATWEAESDFNRKQNLMKTNSISRQEYDIAERKFNVAKADERRATQAVSEAEILLSYSKITAPKDGRIVDRLAEPGDTTQPGKPILTLYDVQTLRLETPVMESLAIKLKVGQDLTVRVDSVNKDFTATIEEIVPQADTASRSFLVKSSLPRSDNLYEGMYGRLQIPAGSRRHLCLATDAIRRVGQLEFVDVVMEDRSLQLRLIKTGRLGMPGRVEVLSGVNAGERVVLFPSGDTP